MAREWREEYKGGIYHVIARGNKESYVPGTTFRRLLNLKAS